MKRLISIIFLILILSSVFAEDFIVGEEPIPPTDYSDQIEMAQIQAQLINLNNKMENIRTESISKADINLMEDQFFIYAEGMLNYFLAQLLLMLGAVMVFFFVLAFIFKAKKWL